VYRAAEIPVDLEAAAQAASFAFYRLDAKAARTKSAFLGLIAKSLAFPSWFGRNWDALEDCLTDLSWIDAPGLVIVLDGFSTWAKVDPDGFVILLDIFKTSAEYWRGEGRAFWVMLPAKPTAQLELPVFT